jgi:hypothetical protein
VTTDKERREQRARRLAERARMCECGHTNDDHQVVPYYRRDDRKNGPPGAVPCSVWACPCDEFMPTAFAMADWR